MKTTRIVVVLVLSALILLTSCGGKSTSQQIRVTIVPATVAIDQGSTQQFTALVSGTANAAVRWSIPAQGSTGGTIDANGLYTAPATAGTFQLVATSAADSTATATAAVSVRSVGIAMISPASADMEPGGAQQFTATVTGTVNHDVSWSVQEGAAGGAITSNGMYTAPASPGTFHVIATSAADKRATNIITVTVATLAVLINPRAVGLLPGGTRALTALVAGCMDDSVTWSVQEGSAGGVITTDGKYTAPKELGQYHVIATSVAHPSFSGMATIVVTDVGFTSAGDMIHTRINHTATALRNGDVLFIGGGQVKDEFWGPCCTSGDTASAELFDPTTGAFRATGAMKTARNSHAATRLNDGRVLVSGGGMGDWASLDSAEIYDPATGQFTPTGKMTAPRMYHTATLLDSGKVLIVGGACGWMMMNCPGEIALAELYDPATGTFTSTGGMREATRSRHSATKLVDGRVLIAGGLPGWDSGGGWGPPTNSAEIYDPQTGTFTTVGSFTGARAYHAATILADGNVLLAGGQYEGEYYKDYDDAQIFNSATNQFGVPIPLNNAHSSHTATSLANGQVLIVGGYDTFITAELFDPATTSFLSTGSMITRRAGHTATLLLDGTGRVLVAGGSGDKSAELYTPRP